MSDKETGTEAFEAARERRIELNVAIANVERAAARASSKPTWRSKLLVELDGVRIALDQHVVEVEGEGGILIEMMITAPRLANKINKVQAEHPVLCAQVAETIETAKSSEDVDIIRTTILDTLGAIARHRQHGADLLYEGYNVDIGGG